MAAVVQHATNRNTLTAATVAITVSATGSGNLLVVCGRYSGSGASSHTVSSVSDGTNTFTLFPSGAVVGSGPNAGTNLAFAYLPSSSSGKTTITITFDISDGATKDGWVWEVSGLTSPTTDGTNSNANGTASGVVMTGASVTTTSTAGFLAAVCSPGSNVVLNPNTGNEFNAGGDNQNGNGGVSALSTTAASHTPAWTSDVTSDSFVTLTVGFKGIPPQVPYQTYMMPFLAQ